MQTGLSIMTRVTEVSSAIKTVDQLGGQGAVYNRALAIPGHLQSYGSPLRSLEYVTMAPTRNPENPTIIGEHTQETDEIYFIVSGESGILITNGREDIVYPGDLVIAPKGTRHSMQNRTDVPLGFLVVEVQAFDRVHAPTILRGLPKQVQSGGSSLRASVPIRSVTIALSQYFSGPWGELVFLQIPADGRIHPHISEENDHILLVVGGNATLLLEQERENAEGFGLSAFIPCGVEQGLINQSSRDPLLVLLINLPHTTSQKTLLKRRAQQWVDELHHA